MMLGQWRQLIVLRMAVVVIAAGVARPAVDQRALVGSLIKLLESRLEIWSRVKYLGPQIREAIARMRSPMKRLFSVVALVAVAAAVLSTPHAAQTLTLRTVIDPAHRFTISVPAMWETVTSTGDHALSATAPAPATGLPDSVDVIVRDMPTVISAQDCVHQAERVMQYIIHSWTTLSKGPDTVADLPAYTHAYTWRAKAGEERWSLQVCVTLGHRAFMLIGTADTMSDGTREPMPVLTSIIDTFRPVGSADRVPATGLHSPQSRYQSWEKKDSL